ncbi:hypothetical protein HOC35_00985 [Candidatus Woesearchaeota archaeon]|jgi:hypothetical protein|nr:hypothetical protein [Candidatus Woesearchaeota archaeon]
MRSDVEIVKTLADVLDNVNNTFLFGMTSKEYSRIGEYLQHATDHSGVNFYKFLEGKFEVPRLPQMNDIVQECYGWEISRGRTASSENPKQKATIIINSMFDPSVFGGDTENYFDRFRKMISDERYNPGIRFILVEDPLLSPKISEKKGEENQLYQAVTYVNMATGESSRLLK